MNKTVMIVTANYEPTNADDKVYSDETGMINTTSDMTHTCVGGFLWDIPAKVTGHTVEAERAKALETTVWTDVHWVSTLTSRPIMAVFHDVPAFKRLILYVC